MNENNGPWIWFPNAERRRRQRIGGALYLGLGAVLLAIAFIAGGGKPDGFWLFAGGIALAVGLVVSGYRRETNINRDTARIETVDGWLFLCRRRTLHAAAFEYLAVTAITVSRQQFSNQPDRMYDTSLGTSFALRLVGPRSRELDRTGDAQAARAWAEEVSKALRLPLREIDERQAQSAEPGRWRGIVPWLILLGAVGAMAWIVYNLARYG